MKCEIAYFTWSLFFVINMMSIFFNIGYTDINSLSGEIRFDVDADEKIEMTLNTHGLGLGITPSTNLHVNGNAMISDQLLIGEHEGSSNLNVSGTIGYGFQTLSSNTTLNDQTFILADSSNDNIILTLPYAANVMGRTYTIKKIASQNSVRIYGGGNLIDQSNHLFLNEGLPFISIISNGEQWFIYNKSASDVKESLPISDNGLLLWLDADDLDGDGISEGLSESGLLSGNVQTWSDKSGLGNDMTQATVDEQPVFSNSVHSNKFALDFDGSNDALTGDAILTEGDDTYTYIAVWYADINQNAVVVEQNHRSSSNGRRGALLLTGADYGYNGQSNDQHDLKLFDTGVFNMSVLILNGESSNNVELYHNQEAVAIGSISITTANLGVDGGFFIAKKFNNSEFLDGKIAEVIVYDHNLSNEDIALLQNYLIEKWDL